MTKEEYEEKDSVVRKYRTLNEQEQKINEIIDNLKAGYVGTIIIHTPDRSISNVHQIIENDIEPLINNAIKAALEGRIKVIEKEKEAI